MRKNASISIIVLFTFLLISLSFLFLFTQLDQRLMISETVYDSAQSGYVAESTLYTCLTEVNLEDYFERLQRPGRPLELPRQSVLDGETKKVILRTVKEENQFNSFELEVATVYKGIRSGAIAYGRWINPIFYQEDGYLTKDELENENFIAKIQDQFERHHPLFQDIIEVREPSQLEISSKELQISPSNTMEDDKLVNVYRNTSKAFMVEEDLKITNRGSLEGVIRLKSGASLEGDFHLNGILILEPESKTYGKIDIYGLCIDLGGDTSGIHSVFSKDETQKYLRSLEGFVDPQVISLEKI